MVSPPHRQSYAERALRHSNPAARLLLETIERKKSNLAVSVDVTKSADFLTIIDVVGPFTHIDMLEDFDETLIEKLQHLSAVHDFVIFEDRKFADIGNTVAQQYSSGIYKIANWSHITNAHAVPGPSIITGLASIGKPLGRGLLLLAEMSTKGSLATGSYTEETVHMARAHKDFVIGFIAQHRMEGVGSIESDAAPSEDFLILTPGVALGVEGDSMCQQYRTPYQVVAECGCDVIIVGRGIYGTDLRQAGTIAARAERYMAEGWAAYLERIAA
ncbi:hypothetical protein AX15_007633 [Amanita polypyramis BW_CC]|nr:hypothetical protein AX15_007633 [Amanita polypyramis BW_CC]